MLNLYPLIRSLLFRCEAEKAHHLTLSLIDRLNRLGLGCLYGTQQVADPIALLGLRFPNRVGLAAGLDKNGAYVQALAKMRFGFLEVGTVTPQPQPGNDLPRLFRLPEKEAIINRMGFNNEGCANFVKHVQAANYAGILGLNIGKNASTPLEEAGNDYRLGLQSVYPYASYVTVNISSPNTKNLRQLQAAHELLQLCQLLKQTQAELTDKHGRYVPLLLKIAPDLTLDQIDVIADVLLQEQIDGVIATNTTLSRDAVHGLPHANEAGGLSGRPVFEKSNEVICQLRHRLPRPYPIIGVGGILSGEDAVAKLSAGADLVQLYTGLIYRGASLVKEAAIACQRARHLDRDM